MKKVLLILALGAFATSCGPSMCDCANASKEQLEDESFADKCEKMEDDWKAKFKEADEDEQKAMRADVDACSEKDND